MINEYPTLDDEYKIMTRLEMQDKIKKLMKDQQERIAFHSKISDQIDEKDREIHHYALINEELLRKLREYENKEKPDKLTSKKNKLKEVIKQVIKPKPVTIVIPDEEVVH